MVRIALYDMTDLANCWKRVYMEHLGNCDKQIGG